MYVRMFILSIIHMEFCACSEHQVHHKQHTQQSFSPAINLKKDLKLVFRFCEVSFQKFGIIIL